MLTELQRRCVDISYRHKLTHVSSVLNTVDVIDGIYKVRKESDPFVLGNSHASLALFVVLEKYGHCDAEEMALRHGTHACRDMEHGVWVSGGSLGQAETVAVGLALACPHHTVYLVTSDGACAEGSSWEAFRIADEWCRNLRATVIANGWGAYRKIPATWLPDYPGVHIHFVDLFAFPFWLRGLPGHYLTLDKSQYEELMR